jgi:hypothetical protein
VVVRETGESEQGEEVISEHLANLKRLAVAGKQLHWVLNASLLTMWSGLIARPNPQGWLPLDYCGCLGFGGRNGVEILPGVVMQANHLGGSVGQKYYNLGAAGQIVTRTMTASAKLPSYDISIAILDSADNGGVKVAPLGDVGFTAPLGTPLVMSDSDAATQTKNAIVANVTGYATSLDGVVAPWVKYGPHSSYSSFWISSASGDSSGGVLMLTDAGPRTVGVRNKANGFIDCCNAAVRKEIDAALQSLGAVAAPPVYITPQQVADACNAAGLNTVAKLTAALKKVNAL